MDQASHEKTPKKILLSGLNTKKTPISTPISRFLLLSHNNSNLTPSSPQTLRSRIVRNPFEHQQTEKLRLPVILSPSLFQAPTTPKREEEGSSNKLEVFEWTIEELSNLNPVNVVPHETQFSHQEIDPQFEEKAQAAISSFFQEQQIVPSPHACNLRKQKIILTVEDPSTNIYNSTALPPSSDAAASNSSAMISSFCRLNTKRDMTTQTALSFPPILPREIEDFLSKYQTVDDNVEKTTDEKPDVEQQNDGNNSLMMDISTLRRKLFIHSPVSPALSDDAFAESVNLNNLSPAPKTPELTRSSFRSSQNINEEAFDVINGDMFGELSPICNNDSSNNCSPTVSSNDISMASDFGQEYTPASRRNGKLKKKRLSESFSLLQNDFNSDPDDNKENFHQEFPANKDRRLFGRFDSGFENGDSNQMNYSFSSEFMQI